MLQAAAGLDALRRLRCGTRTVPLRTRHTFSGAAYFNFSHVSRSDRVLNPPKKQFQKRRPVRSNVHERSSQGGSRCFWFGEAKMFGPTPLPACLPACLACCSPLSCESRCQSRTLRDFTFYWTGGKKRGWTSVSFQMEEPKQRQQINSFRDMKRTGRTNLALTY